MAILIIGKDNKLKCDYIEYIINKLNNCVVISDKKIYYKALISDDKIFNNINDLVNNNYMEINNNKHNNIYVIVDSLTSCVIHDILQILRNRTDKSLSITSFDQYNLPKTNTTNLRLSYDNITFILIMDYPINLDIKVKNSINKIINTDTNKYSNVNHNCMNNICVNTDFSKLYDFI